MARFQRFLPAGRTQAPTVAGRQAGKAVLRHRRRKIIAAGLGKLEKRGGHDGADRVTANVFWTGVAAAVSKEPRHWLDRAVFQPVAEDIPGRPSPTPSIPAVIPQQCQLLDRRHASECRRLPSADLRELSRRWRLAAMVNRAAAGGTTIASKRISNRREVWKALHGPQDPPRGQLRVRFGLRRLRKWCGGAPVAASQIAPAAAQRGRVCQSNGRSAALGAARADPSGD